LPSLKYEHDVKRQMKNINSYAIWRTVNHTLISLITEY